MDFLGSYNEIYLRKFLTSPLRHYIERTGRSNDVPSSISETWHLLEPVFLLQKMTSLCSWCLQSGWNFLFVLLIFFFLSTFWMEFFEVRTVVQTLTSFQQSRPTQTQSHLCSCSEPDLWECRTPDPKM